MTHTEDDAYAEGFQHGYHDLRPSYAGKAGHLKAYIEGYLDGEAQSLDDECCDFRWDTAMENFA
jgi:hypothetical protein